MAKYRLGNLGSLSGLEGITPVSAFGIAALCFAGDESYRRRC